MNNIDGRIISNVLYDDHELVIEFSDGSKIKMHHHQDCCESVYISECDIPADIIGATFHRIEEKDCESPDSGSEYERIDAYFYEIHSSCGTIDVHWQGTSNGYYSTSVDICDSKEKSCRY